MEAKKTCEKCGGPMDYDGYCFRACDHIVVPADRIPASPAETTPFEELVDALVREARMDLRIIPGHPPDPANARVVAARQSLIDAYKKLERENNEGIVRLGCIPLMIGGHYREGVWFLEHPKAPAPIPCESIPHMVEKYLAIIEHFDAEKDAELSRLRALALTAEEAQMLHADFFGQADVSDEDRKWQRLVGKLRRIANGETEA